MAAVEHAEKVAQMWEEVKTLTELSDADMLKAFRGNRSASIRSRKALRAISKHIKDLVKETKLMDKLYTAEKKSKQD